MRPGLLIIGLLATAAFVFWQSGGVDRAGLWLLETQRELQGVLAGAVRALRAGEPEALAALLGLSAAYGFFHAVGPGHGKAVIGAASVATRAGAGRMAVLSILGALGQGAVAIALVYGGFALLAWPTRGAEQAAERWLLPLGSALIAGIGGWLVWRGARRLLARAEDDHHHHGGCDHDHGPDPAAVAQATSLRAQAAIVLAVAARPCTGALIVLVMCWRLGLVWQGALAAMVMALGTAVFTTLVAVGGVWMRRLTWIEGAEGSAAISRGFATAQIVVGAALALAAVSSLALSQG